MSKKSASMPVVTMLAMAAAWSCSTAKDGNMDGKNGTDVARITPKQAAERAFRAAAEPLKSTMAEITPPFPLKWPPAGERTAVYFAYVKVPLPTSTDLSEVHTPYLRIEISLDVSDAPKTSVTRLDSRPAQFSEPSSAIVPESEAMVRAADVLFDAVCSKPGGAAEPSGAAAVTLRTAYRKWIAEHQSVGLHLREFFPGFFTWIESNQ